MDAVPGLVSIGLPVRNGEDRVGDAIATVLAQDYENIELIIADNASDDGTEEICRTAAAADPRVRYVRHPRDIGLHDNFNAVLGLAHGGHFKWIGDDDELEPTFLTRCLDKFASDPRLVLVTTQQRFIGDDGRAETARYDRCELASDDPVTRMTEMLRLQTETHLLLDPLYGLMRTRAARAVPPRKMLRQDEVFATRLALEGPWGHVSEILAHRHWKGERRSVLARRLDVPVSRTRVINLIQLRELRRDVEAVGLVGDARRRAHRSIWRWYGRRHRRLALSRSGRVVSAIIPRATAVPGTGMGRPG
jgi:glycosyltransferase involved in cell wall biosynthesis